MVEKLFLFLKSRPGSYPFSYPEPDLESQVQKYFSFQYKNLSRGCLSDVYSFGWSLDRQEDALAILAHTELLYSMNMHTLLGKWLEYQPDDVFDLIYEYFTFHNYKLEY